MHTTVLLDPLSGNARVLASPVLCVYRRPRNPQGGTRCLRLGGAHSANLHQWGSLRRSCRRETKNDLMEWLRARRRSNVDTCGCIIGKQCASQVDQNLAACKKHTHRASTDVVAMPLLKAVGVIWQRPSAKASELTSLCDACAWQAGMRISAFCRVASMRLGELV